MAVTERAVIVDRAMLPLSKQWQLLIHRPLGQMHSDYRREGRTWGHLGKLIHITLLLFGKY